MDKNNQGLSKVAWGLTPLCITFVATAIVIQDAHIARAVAFASDEPVPGIWEWISPVALIFLAAGYVISTAVAAITLRK